MRSPTPILDGEATCAFHGDVVVIVFGVRAWTLETVHQLYRDTAALGPPVPHALVRYAGAEPGPAARKLIAERQVALEKEHPFEGQRRTAIVTDSALTRGAMTAYGWLTGKTLRGFSSASARDAARWVSGSDDSDDAGAVVYDFYQGCLAQQTRRSP